MGVRSSDRIESIVDLSSPTSAARNWFLLCSSFRQPWYSKTPSAKTNDKRVAIPVITHSHSSSRGRQERSTCEKSSAATSATTTGIIALFKRDLFNYQIASPRRLKPSVFRVTPARRTRATKSGAVRAPAALGVRGYYTAPPRAARAILVALMVFLSGVLVRGCVG